MVEQWNRYNGTVEDRWWTSGKMIVERWKRCGGTVEK